MHCMLFSHEARFPRVLKLGEACAPRLDDKQQTVAEPSGVAATTSAT